MEEWIEANREPALEEWLIKIGGSQRSTQRYYKIYFRLFCERWEKTPQQIYEMLEAQENGTKLSDKGRLKNRILATMKELETGTLPRRLYDTGLIKPGRKTPATCRQVQKAISSFSRTWGVKIYIDPGERPKGKPLGQRGMSTEHVAKTLEEAGDENRLRNRALVHLLKDSGLRASDLPQLNLSHYHEAEKRSGDGETYLVFDPERTQKCGVWAHIHIGPEAVEALNAYIERERGDPSLGGGALFLMRKPKHEGGQGLKPDRRISAANISKTIRRMMERALGKDVKRRSGHSLRKYHRTKLQPFLPERWINYMQGKAHDPYTKAIEVQPGELFNLYVKAYAKLRVRPAEASRDEVERLRAEVERVRTSAGEEIMELRDQVAELREARDAWKEASGAHKRRADRMVDEIFSNPELMQYLKEKMAKAFEDAEVKQE